MLRHTRTARQEEKKKKRAGLLCNTIYTTSLVTSNQPSPSGTKSAWSVKTRPASSRYCRDASVYGRKTTAMHDMSRVSPPPTLQETILTACSENPRWPSRTTSPSPRRMESGKSSCRFQQCSRSSLLCACTPCRSAAARV